MGVILMVAITVILAAVIAAFVLDMGDMGETAPTASFNWDQENDNSDISMTVTHTGGDELDASEITVEINGNAAEHDEGDEWNGDSVEISAGSSFTFEEDDTSSDLSEGDQINIVWESDDGNSQIIDDYEVN
ncbi:hypothetical protein BBD46_11500 [Natrialba sp. SSL1]|nr:hypothetical protein BBD46_11500 [Natrialba sp. SSL1]